MLVGAQGLEPWTYLNTTWVAREIKHFKVPADEELFGAVMKETALFEGY